MPIEQPELGAPDDQEPGTALGVDASKSKKELYDEARNAGIEGRSAMTKEELIEALGNQQKRSPRRTTDARRPDRCAIVYRGSGRQGEFQVVVIDADGSRKSVARSPGFRAPRVGAVRRSGAARAAHDVLVRRLEACGWWPAGSGRKWYELGFVRLRTAGMGSVSSLVTVVREAGEGRFVAEELDTYGNPTPLLVSPAFRARRVRSVQPSPNAKAALRHLVKAMERDDWTVAGTVGAEWYAVSLSRRPVTDRRMQRSA
jgi:hypothetical protein